MHLSLIIPLYISDPLHLDFTRQTLESIKTKHDYRVLLIVNYCAPQFKADLKKLVTGNRSLVTNPHGNILAAAWNLGIKTAFGQKPEKNKLVTGHWSLVSDYTLILNNDIILHPHCIDNLVAFAQAHPEFLLHTASQWPSARTLTTAPLTDNYSLHPHFSCFMVSQKTIQEVGYFDEHFTMGYFEDNDYHTRMLVKGYQAAATDSAKFYHYGSRTISVDDSLKPLAQKHYQQNRAYFQKKWGLDIHAKAFDPPEEILKHIKPK
jgi:GT2 family glycosyltransferase